MKQAGIERQALILVGPALAARKGASRPFPNSMTRALPMDGAPDHPGRNENYLMPKKEIKTRVVALTPRGGALARNLARGLPQAGCWLPRALAAGDPKVQTFDRVAAVFQEAFQQGENLVCIMAAGIVVRGIAPHLAGKDKDPAVVVVDEAGQFAISLLSGHLGGANELARQVAQILKPPRLSPRPPTSRGCRPWTWRPPGRDWPSRICPRSARCKWRCCPA